MLRSSPRFVPTGAGRLLAALPLLLALAQPSAAQPLRPGTHLPPGYVEEPDVPPEDPLPPLPQPLPVAPDEPLVIAPDAVELLKECKQPAFTDCFRLWQPPPPPPEPEKETAGPPPPPPPPPRIDPNAPRQPAQGGPVPPPPADQAKEAAAAAADRATLDALSKALKDSGLDGKVLLTNPGDGDPTLKLDSQPGRPAAKP
ncbi:hypothetical protein A6A40_05180 [Azospirillum humicireducens]|uniref:Energy transducer TonB n=1 Tax=Azospirillum humicireducens TaxID=1226968 RepID=A0A160JET0_9PROT|nr:hypothetical protein [Azospirillum humicireducens]ANC91345.1 hypothetical protein A6A40_05180 [Azospirillum humicireducens]